MTDIQKGWILLLFSCFATFLFFLFVPPFGQDKVYHNFADTAGLFGMPNFLNVLSSLSLLGVGLWGLALIRKDGLVHDNAGKYPAYSIFFAGLALTGLGSAYYHLMPDNATLVWDRMPMAISFSAFTVALVSEHVMPRIEKVLLYPFLGYGIFSVLYWYFTELRGQGDLRFYAVVQFLPLLIIPVLCVFFRSRFTRNRDVIIAFILYAIGKLAEHFDQAILSLTGFVSGHTLKHLFAALATFWILRMLRLREHQGSNA